MAANASQRAMGELFSCSKNNPCSRVDSFYCMNAEPQLLVRTSVYTALSADGHWMQLALGVRRDTVVSRATIDVVAALRTN